MVNSTKIIADKLIDRVTFLKKRSFFLRWDVAPFLLFYSILFYFATIKENSYKVYSLIILPVCLAMHLLMFLLSQWSVALRAKIGNVETNTIQNAELILVKAAENVGKDRIVVLHRRQGQFPVFSVAGCKFQLEREYFEFQKVCYCYDPDKNNFAPLQYPTGAPVLSYLHSKGHESEQSIGLGYEKWGPNEFDIPIPGFLDLYLVSIFLLKSKNLKFNQTHQFV